MGQNGLVDELVDLGSWLNFCLCVFTAGGFLSLSRNLIGDVSDGRLVEASWTRVCFF